METLPATAASAILSQAIVRNLRRRFAPALLDAKRLDGRNAVPAGPERLRGFRETEAQRTNDTSGHNGNARVLFLSVRSLGISHFGEVELAGIPVAFRGEKPYLSRRKGNGSSGSWWIVS